MNTMGAHQIAAASLPAMGTITVGSSLYLDRAEDAATSVESQQHGDKEEYQEGIDEEEVLAQEDAHELGLKFWFVYFITTGALASIRITGTDDEKTHLEPSALSFVWLCFFLHHICTFPVALENGVQGRGYWICVVIMTIVNGIGKMVYFILVSSEASKTFPPDSMQAKILLWNMGLQPADGVFWWMHMIEFICLGGVMFTAFHFCSQWTHAIDAGTVLTWHSARQHANALVKQEPEGAQHERDVKSLLIAMIVSHLVLILCICQVCNMQGLVLLCMEFACHVCLVYGERPPPLLWWSVKMWCVLMISLQYIYQFEPLADCFKGNSKIWMLAAGFKAMRPFATSPNGQYPGVQLALLPFVALASHYMQVLTAFRQREIELNIERKEILPDMNGTHSPSHGASGMSGSGSGEKLKMRIQEVHALKDEYNAHLLLNTGPDRDANGTHALIEPWSLLNDEAWERFLKSDGSVKVIQQVIAAVDIAKLTRSENTLNHGLDKQYTYPVALKNAESSYESDYTRNDDFTWQTILEEDTLHVSNGFTRNTVVWDWFERKSRLKLEAEDLRQIYLRTRIEGNEDLDISGFVYEKIGTLHWLMLYWRLNAHTFACSGVAVWAVYEPSGFAVSMLLLAYVGLHLSASQFGHVRYFLLCYSFLYLLMQYSANIVFGSGLIAPGNENPTTSIFKAAGFVEQKQPGLGLVWQMLTYLVFVVLYSSYCPHIWERHQLDSDLMAHPSSVKITEIKAAIQLVQASAYLILALMYLFGVIPAARDENGATLLFGGYVVVSTIFICCPSWTQHYWFVAADYPKATVLILYMVQFFDFDSNRTYAKLFGFKHANVQWNSSSSDSSSEVSMIWYMTPHLALLVLTALQHGLFRTELFAENMIKRASDNSMWTKLTQSQSRLGFMYRYIFSRSQAVEHLTLLVAYFWLMFVAVSQIQALTSLFALVLFFLCLGALQDGVDGATHTILWSPGVLVFSGTLVVAYYVQAMNWKTPDAYKYVVGLHSDDDAYYQEFIFAIFFATILFVMAITVRRILSTYGQRAAEVQTAQASFEEETEKARALKEREMQDGLQEQSEGKANRDRRRRSAFEELADQIEVDEQAEAYIQENEAKGLERETSEFLAAIQLFLYRLAAISARPLVTVFCFYTSLSNINVFGAILCVYSLLDCALGGIFDERGMQSDSTDADADLLMESSESTETSQPSVADSIPGETELPAADDSSCRSEEKRFHVPMKAYGLPLRLLYLLVEFYMIAHFSFQFKFVRDKVLFINNNHTAVADFCGFEILGKDSSTPFDMRYMLLVLLAVFAQYASVLGSSQYQPAEYIRYDGINVCYLFKPRLSPQSSLQTTMKEQSLHQHQVMTCPRMVEGGILCLISESRVVLQGFFYDYSFILVSTLALLAGTSRPNASSVLYGLLACLTSFASKRYIYNWWRVVLSFLALYVAFQYGSLLIGEYAATGNWRAPWAGMDHEWRLWIGVEIETENYLLFDFATLFAAGSLMRVLTFMGEVERDAWFDEQEKGDARLSESFSENTRRRAKVLEDRLVINQGAYDEEIGTLQAKLQAIKMKIQAIKIPESPSSYLHAFASPRNLRISQHTTTFKAGDSSVNPEVLHSLRLVSQEFLTMRELQLVTADAKTVTMKSLRCDMPIEINWEEEQAERIRMRQTGGVSSSSDMLHPLKVGTAQGIKYTEGSGLGLDKRTVPRNDQLAAWHKALHDSLEEGEIEKHDKIKKEILDKCQIYVQKRDYERIHAPGELLGVENSMENMMQSAVQTPEVMQQQTAEKLRIVHKLESIYLAPRVLWVLIFLVAATDCNVLNSIYILGFFWYYAHHRSVSACPNPFWFRMRCFNLVCFLGIFFSTAPFAEYNDERTSLTGTFILNHEDHWWVHAVVFMLMGGLHEIYRSSEFAAAVLQYEQMCRDATTLAVLQLMDEEQIKANMRKEKREHAATNRKQLGEMKVNLDHFLDVNLKIDEAPAPPEGSLPTAESVVSDGGADELQSAAMEPNRFGESFFLANRLRGSGEAKRNKLKREEMQRADTAAQQLEIDVDLVANVSLPLSAGHLRLLSLYDEAIAMDTIRITLVKTIKDERSSKDLKDIHKRTSFCLTEFKDLQMEIESHFKADTRWWRGDERGVEREDYVIDWNDFQTLLKTISDTLGRRCKAIAPTEIPSDDTESDKTEKRHSDIIVDTMCKVWDGLCGAGYGLVDFIEDLVWTQTEQDNDELYRWAISNFSMDGDGCLTETEFQMMATYIHENWGIKVQILAGEEETEIRLSLGEITAKHQRDQEQVFSRLADSVPVILPSTSVKLKAKNGSVPWYKPWCRKLSEYKTRKALRHVRATKKRRDPVRMLTAEIEGRLRLQTKALVEALPRVGRQEVETQIMNEGLARAMSDSLFGVFKEIQEQAHLTFNNRYNSKGVDSADAAVAMFKAMGGNETEQVSCQKLEAFLKKKPWAAELVEGKMFELDWFFNEFDPNGNGELDMAEFMHLYKELLGPLESGDDGTAEVQQGRADAGFSTSRYGIFEKFETQINNIVRDGMHGSDTASLPAVEELSEFIWEAVICKIRMLTWLGEARLLVRSTSQLYKAELQLRSMSEAELDVEEMAKVLARAGDALGEAGRLEKAPGLWMNEAAKLRKLSTVLSATSQSFALFAVQKMTEFMMSLAKDKMIKTQLNDVKEVRSEEAHTLDRETTFQSFVRAIWLAMDYNSSDIVYIIIVCSHACSGSLSSMFLPILAVLYGIQAHPRPSSQYWLLMMIYETALIYFKYMARLRFICQDTDAYKGATVGDGCRSVGAYDNTHTLTYLEWPYLLGIMPGPSDTLFVWDVGWDVLIMVTLLWRQLHLRRVGQWRSAHSAFSRVVVAQASVQNSQEAKAFEACRKDVRPHELERAVLMLQSLVRAVRHLRWSAELKEAVGIGPTETVLQKHGWEDRLRSYGYEVVWDPTQSRYKAPPPPPEEEIRKQLSSAQLQTVDATGYDNVKRKIEVNYDVYSSLIYATNHPCREEMARRIAADEVINAVKAKSGATFLTDLMTLQFCSFLWRSEKTDDVLTPQATETPYYAKDLYVSVLSWQLVTLVYFCFAYPQFDPSICKLKQSGIEVVGGGMSSDYVDASFLLWIVLIFLEIVLDRVIYLLSSIQAKRAVQLITVVMYHYLLLVYYRMQCTELNGSVSRHNLIAIFYALRAGYWYVSAAQIRCGYPMYSHGEWLLARDERDDPEGKGLIIVEPTIVTNILYKGYLLVPLLFEMRALLDWCLTDTCLDIIEWIKLADIHSTLFKVAYLRAQEHRAQRYVGELQPLWYRWLVGGGVFLLLCILIWTPLFVFSSGSPFLTSNPVTQVELSATLYSPWSNFDIWRVNTNQVKIYTDQMEQSVSKNRAYLGRAQTLQQQQTKSGNLLQMVQFVAPSATEFKVPPQLISEMLSDSANTAYGGSLGGSGAKFHFTFQVEAQLTNASMDQPHFTTSEVDFGSANVEALLDTLAYIYRLNRTTGEPLTGSNVIPVGRNNNGTQQTTCSASCSDQFVNHCAPYRNQGYTPCRKSLDEGYWLLKRAGCVTHCTDTTQMEELRIEALASRLPYRIAVRYFLTAPLFPDIINQKAPPEHPVQVGSYSNPIRLMLVSNGNDVWFTLEFVTVDKPCINKYSVLIPGWTPPTQKPNNATIYDFNTVVQKCTHATNWDGTQESNHARGYNSFVVYSDPVPTGLFADSSYNLTGLYIGVILVVANAIRTGISGLSQRIIFEDMELPTKPISLCVHISRARECQEFKLEHDLYLYLIDLFRQPQKLYHATTRPERDNLLWHVDNLPENRRPPLEPVEFHRRPTSEQLEAACGP